MRMDALKHRQESAPHSERANGIVVSPVRYERGDDDGVMISKMPLEPGDSDAPNDATVRTKDSTRQHAVDTARQRDGLVFSKASVRRESEVPPLHRGEHVRNTPASNKGRHAVWSPSRPEARPLHLDRASRLAGGAVKRSYDAPNEHQKNRKRMLATGDRNVSLNRVIIRATSRDHHSFSLSGIMPPTLSWISLCDR